MDKFEQSITDAQESITPSVDFVAATMHRINGQIVNRRRLFRLWLPVLAGSLAAIALVLFNVMNPPAKPPAPQLAQTPQSGNSQQSAAPSTAAQGTDNSSLSNELAAIGGDLSKGNNYLASASSAVNDQQQAISVPTN